MRRALGFPALCLLLGLHAAGCLSRNNDHFLAIRQKSGKPAFIYHHSQDIEKSLDIAPQKTYKHNYHSSSEAQIGKHHQIVNSAFPKPAYDTSLNLLATAGQDLEVENRPVPAANVIVVKEMSYVPMTVLPLTAFEISGPLNVLCKAYHIVIMSAVAITVMIVMVLMITSRLSILLLIYSALGVKSQYCNGLLALLYKPRRYSLTQ